MAIYVGNQKIKDIYLGSQKIKEVYRGGQLVYTAVVDPRSYWISTTGVKSYFDLENTPIVNFCTSGTTNTDIYINNVAVRKSTVAKIVFGISYEDITALGDHFVSQFGSLTYVDLSVFTKVTIIGTFFLYSCVSLLEVDLSAYINVSYFNNYFMRGCNNLTEIDLSPFSKVQNLTTGFLTFCNTITTIDLSVFGDLTNVGGDLLQNCVGLTSIYIGSLNFNNISVTVGSAFGSVPNISSNTIYADTIALANAFKDKFPNLSNWSVAVG